MPDGNQEQVSETFDDLLDGINDPVEPEPADPPDNTDPCPTSDG